MQLAGRLLHNCSHKHQLLTKGSKAVFRDGGEAQGIQLVWNGWQSPWVFSIRRCPGALCRSACVKNSTHQWMLVQPSVHQSSLLSCKDCCRSCELAYVVQFCCVGHAYAGHFQAARQLSQSLQPNAQQPAECPHTWCAGLLTAPKVSKAGRHSHAEQA